MSGILILILQTCIEAKWVTFNLSGDVGPGLTWNDSLKIGHLNETELHASVGLFLLEILSLRFNGHFSRWSCVSQYQNVSILDFIGAKDDGGGGDNWSYKTWKISRQSV